MAAIFVFLYKILGFYYDFNVYEILSVIKKNFDFLNSKYRIQYGGMNVKKFKNLN